MCHIQHAFSTIPIVTYAVILQSILKNVDIQPWAPAFRELHHKKFRLNCEYIILLCDLKEAL